MGLALFLAGVATFALLYSTQALLPLISGDMGVTASDASWTVAAATGGLAVFVLPMSALSGASDGVQSRRRRWRSR